MNLLVMGREALRSLARHPLRSCLTLLGFAIGVGAFIAMVCFTDGARKSVMAQFEGLGAGTFTVYAGGQGARPGQPQRLFTPADEHFLVGRVDAIHAVAPMSRQLLTVSSGSRRIATQVLGTTPAFARIRNRGAEAGGIFDEQDLAMGARVCVIGYTIADQVFGEAAQPSRAIGQTLRIGDVDCRVIGVLLRLGESADGTDQDNLVLVPFGVFIRRVAGVAGADRLLIGLVPGFDIPRAREAVRQALRARRRLGPADPDDFTIRSPDDLTRVVDRTSRLLQGLLGSIAAVSLLVGGIGIMNILLVSVGERTREIGVRAALGATPGQIMLQFLVEATTLSGLGAAFGAAGGATAAALVGHRMGWSSDLPLGLMAMALIGGIALGLLFGLYPARRAALLDPVVALRGE